MCAGQETEPSNTIAIYFQVKTPYCERALEELLENLERRGGVYSHRGQGSYCLQIPVRLPWLPFYQSVKDCIEAVYLVGVTPMPRPEPIFSPV